MSAYLSLGIVLHLINKILQYPYAFLTPIGHVYLLYLFFTLAHFCLFMFPFFSIRFSLHALYLIWHLLTPILAIFHTMPFSFYGITHPNFIAYCSNLMHNPPFLYVLTEDGSSFALKHLIEFVIKDFSIVLIKDLP